MRYILIVVLVAIIIFFVCRELFCWYWKINEIRDLLQSINSSQGCQRFSEEKITELINLLKEIKENTAKVKFTGSNQDSFEQKDSNTEDNNSEEINTYEDLLKNPKIKEEAETMRKFYGKEAYEHYLEKKLKETKNS